MVNFPVFESIDIVDYGLFPGPQNDEPGLHIKFQPGLSLILGANGLGKTTLITILYRMLTGPYDIPGLADNSELGFARITPKRRPTADNKIFADRVLDNARNARAILSFQVGSYKVLVERRLSDLSLLRFTIDNQNISTSDEEIFQAEILKLSKVLSFGDWILLLKYLIFYFEDRRALVWDPSAQRQILRILFLDANIANKWTKDERTILELDSQMRNLKAVLGKQEQNLAGDEEKITVTGTDIRQELEDLQKLQAVDLESREYFNRELEDMSAARQKARLRLLTAEKEREELYRNIERVKLAAIGAKFPDSSETARYILAQFLVDGNCIICGNFSPSAVFDYTSRMTHKQCVICGSNLDDSEIEHTIAVDGTGKTIAQIELDLKLAETYLSEARIEFDKTEADYVRYIEHVNELNTNINERAHQIEQLIRQLPPEESALYEKRSTLEILRTQVEKLKEDLQIRREHFDSFMKEINYEIVKAKELVKSTFDIYAEGFLIEHCQLIWSPQETTVGQTGIRIAFPAFELDMTGVNFPGAVRRSAPEQVSESQREFIDLAFRMSLMSVSTEKSSSLVMDAPESSLDAVFSSRAAVVLSRYGEPADGNRLIITSNLVEGQLIPELISKSTTPENRAMHVVDLLKLAVPTAAVREHKKDYEAIRDKLLSGIINNGE